MEINLSKYSPISLFIYFANAFTATFCSHVTAQSTAEWSQSRSPSNLVSGHVSTMWLIVCTPPHWHLSDDVMCHLWRSAAQRPCPVRKRFNIDDAERPRLKPGSRIVGSAMRFLLATETDCLPLGWMKCRLETGQTKSAFWKLGEVEGGWRSPGTLDTQGDFQQFAAACHMRPFVVCWVLVSWWELEDSLLKSVYWNDLLLYYR